MCQFCKRECIPFADTSALASMIQGMFAGQRPFVSYGGKFYHPECYEKLEMVARRTGGVL